ncbi:endonuclease/exonuclease/phosphatase family protein [Pseudomonas gingeri]|uniref:endonuclease/exonuclease/phosphatase family protein n=1 Tax=Pseudomonas gingeri TaxID=117681 RepID=UPI00159F940E|nr:endonuclease/exonuclease/phosphatase family protein [Pseudomonas gingeri]NWA02310.1 endonuclease/exonuclease/phosphatase family protein [Pseudomonas gingeri]NWA12517.1 endonuclease/exonuclease/phosphatase family protein [Pseudomonas gingeri]NWA57077.1 endonuclease/exonuclease/phosphatase family protein [Pseudomonas gingeri]NWA93420.1 endonuclease/exonuclease/phosphatase family protein [Pseudomonas gingeri]NWB02892.1 endonuclease/exonuclease/phosphatase family protein [Pseudomonas gingeri]
MTSNGTTGSCALPDLADITRQATTVQRFTVLTLNLHKGFTPLNRRFILPELRDAVRTTGADLVFLQEVHGRQTRHASRHPAWPSLPQYEFLADTMWPEFAYGRNAVYPDGDHGNALLSKFPIQAYDNLDVSVHGNERRGLLHCRLDMPGHEQVHAICVHLGLREAHRQRQIDLLLDHLDSLPPAASVIIAGDFNDWRRRADTRLAAQSLIEAFSHTRGAPARSFPARLPLLRLDRIYLRNALPGTASVLSAWPWSHLSDHAPLAVEVLL